MAFKREALSLERKKFSECKAKKYVKQGNSYPYRGAAVMTRGKKRTNKG